MKKTRTEISRAERKAEIAIDKLIDLQDMGFGNDAITRTLESLNQILNDLRRLNS